MRAEEGEKRSKAAKNAKKRLSLRVFVHPGIIEGVGRKRWNWWSLDREAAVGLFNVALPHLLALTANPQKN
jgi:hypothetical protein